MPFEDSSHRMRARIAALALTVGAAACGATDTDDAEPSSGGMGSGGSSAAGGSGGSGGSSGFGGTPSPGGSGGVATGGASSGGTAAGGAGTAGGATGGGTGTIDCRQDADGVTTLVFVNRCATTVTFRGSDIDGADVAPGAFACVDIGTADEVLSAKRYWGFAGADPGAEHHTLAEFTFNTEFNDFDWYNISHVDAHNLPMQIAPADRPDCETLTCAQDFLADCPAAGQFRNAGGEVVACVSPNRDDPGGEVPLYFEACDDAYAWSGDDQNGDDPSPVRACAGEDWDITFCPAGDG